MKKITSGTKNIFYAKSHHMVLEAWALLRRRSTSTPHLITLDRHTDLRDAFFRASHRSANSSMNMTRSQIEAGAVSRSAILESLKASDVKKSIRNLAHDEHIDAARRARIIDKVFLLQSSTIGSEVSWANITQIDVDDAGTADVALMPCILDPFIEKIEAETGSNIENLEYILDIDLDYFFTRGGAQPADPSSFHRLARGAALITVALEPNCVREPMLLDPGISAKRLLQIVAAEIAKA